MFSEDFVDICRCFWGSSQIGLYLEVISMHFGVFSEGQGLEWRIFLVATTSNIYLGVITNWTIFRGHFYAF